MIVADDDKDHHQDAERQQAKKWPCLRRCWEASRWRPVRALTSSCTSSESTCSPGDWSLLIDASSSPSLPGRLRTTSTPCKRSGWKTTRCALTHSPGGSFGKENEHNKNHFNTTIQSPVSRTQGPSSLWAQHGRSTLPMGEPLRLSPLLRATPSSR